MLKKRFQNLSGWIWGNRWDVLILMILGICAGIGSFVGMGLFTETVINEDLYDVWFSSDIPRIYANMVSRVSDHHRTKVHPLFSVLAFPPVLILRKVFGIEDFLAVQLVVALVAFLWTGALYILLRMISRRILDSLVFSILGMVSASAVFWFIVPETYALGSLSILSALILVVAAERRKVADIYYVIANALTLSVTITNWMVGIFATLVNRSWRRALQIFVNAFAIVVLLWGVQKFIFPSADFFIGETEELNYISNINANHIFRVLKSFFFHTVVMPPYKIKENTRLPDWPRIFTQKSNQISGINWGTAAVIFWAVLLVFGIWVLFRLNKHRELRLVVGLSLGGQILLHLVYGSEVFLYSLHFLPLLITLVFLPTLTRLRWATLVIAGVLSVLLGFNNWIQLNNAVDYFEVHGSQSRMVKVQKELRPEDPWPRDYGHVILARPGSSEINKGYHEPGGNFSPAPGSFGISIWLRDKNRDLIITGEEIKLEDISQRFSWFDRDTPPGILTETDDYSILWSSKGDGLWRMQLKSDPESKLIPEIVLRSVGPAGGQLNSLDWNGMRLLVNKRWSLKVDPSPLKVNLGEELEEGWKNLVSDINRQNSDTGWGFARFALDESGEWDLVIRDNQFEEPIQGDFQQTGSDLELDLPDKKFLESLEAQAAHIMMGLVGDQTRPGDPTNYPLAWQRDGSYVLIALARTGYVELAKELAVYFAENDFFGGFGSEADAPGLSIWALSEVAAQVDDPDFDQDIWPHIRRKADLILELVETEKPVHIEYAGPVLLGMEDNEDRTLVAEPAKNGLIVGRMDHHFPIMYVNAVSYRGLEDAAEIAERVNRAEDSDRYLQAASKIKNNWEKAFIPPESDNDRTYISGLWPTWVAESSTENFEKNLEKRWERSRDEQGGFIKNPVWTYFDLAEAHQWLFLERQEYVWETVNWFWENQASPGLYTWWEGEGKNDNFDRWEEVRGWIDAPHITPHYWTAAEMLLLQLDMLAYSYREGGQSTVVLGAGIPGEWLEQPMSVKGLRLREGRLDWQWDGSQVEIDFHGEPVEFRLGQSFPPGTRLKIKYAGSGSEP